MGALNGTVMAQKHRLWSWVDVFQFWCHRLPTYLLCGLGHVALPLCSSVSPFVKWEQYPPAYQLVLRVE